jgi:hypothetical protein
MRGERCSSLGERSIWHHHLTQFSARSTVPQGSSTHSPSRPSSFHCVIHRVIHLCWVRTTRECVHIRHRWPASTAGNSEASIATIEAFDQYAERRLPWTIQWDRLLPEDPMLILSGHVLRLGGSSSFLLFPVGIPAGSAETRLSDDYSNTLDSISLIPHTQFLWMACPVELQFIDVRPPALKGVESSKNVSRFNWPAAPR